MMASDPLSVPTIMSVVPAVKSLCGALRKNTFRLTVTAVVVSKKTLFMEQFVTALLSKSRPRTKARVQTELGKPFTLIEFL
jgi:hypothetical protein